MNAAIVVAAGIVVVIATIIVLIAGRRDADPERVRTLARYVDAVNLLSVFVVLFAAYAVVAQLTRFIIPERQRFGYSPGFIDAASGAFAGSADRFVQIGNDGIWRGTVQAALVLLAAGLILSFHWRQRQTMVSGAGFGASSGARVDLAFRYAVCFVAAFVVLMSLAFGLYGLFRIAAPGVASVGRASGERERGIAQALSLLALGGGALLVFRMHWSDTMRPTPRDEPTATAPGS